MNEPRYTLAELLSLADAAATLGIPIVTAKRRASARGLGRKIARDLILTPADLDALAADIPRGRRWPANPKGSPEV